MRKSTVEVRMDIRRVFDLESPDAFPIPAILLAPLSPRSSVVLVHAYAAAKEQMIGLALRLGEQHVATLVIDLGGHGENEAPMGARILGEVESAITRLRADFEFVGCLGVGLGARLTLHSSADYIVAIAAPTVRSAIRRQRFDMPFDLPARTPEDEVANVMKDLPAIRKSDRDCLLIYVEGDPRAAVTARELEPLLPKAEGRYVEPLGATREDLIPREWQLLLNPSAIETACNWLAEAPERVRAERGVHV
jgi:hypothetical protein